METFAPHKKVKGPILPKFVLGLSITSGAKIMYAVLCDYASYYKSDHCYPSHAKLAEKLSCSVSSVKNYLAELVGAKLISVQRKHNSSSRYYMLWPAALDTAEAGNHEPKTAPGQPEVDYAQPKSGYINNLTKQQNQETPPLPPVPVPRSVPPASRPVRGGGAFSHDFEKLCAAYPKKEALAFARTVYQKLWRNGLLPSLDVLLASIEKFKATESWQQENGRFYICWKLLQLYRGQSLRVRGPNSITTLSAVFYAFSLEAD
jgi:hypothetical protein